MSPAVGRLPSRDHYSKETRANFQAVLCACAQIVFPRAVGGLMTLSPAPVHDNMPPEPQAWRSPMKKNLVKIIIITVLTAVFVYFFARSVKWGEVLKSVTNVNLPLFLLAFPLSALHFFTRGFRWRYLLLPE